jgi:outer membrane protein OmpA-like peptidoglycan-associated protein
LRHLAAISAVALLAACAPMQPQATAPTVASNPPPVAPGAEAIWYQIGFATDSFAIDAKGQAVVAEVLGALKQNPNAVATIIGRTDTVGSKDYNMRLSSRRADAVRDALVYSHSMSGDRVETRWTGENRPDVATADEVAASGNRVVDIAIH